MKSFIVVKTKNIFNKIIKAIRLLKEKIIFQ